MSTPIANRIARDAGIPDLLMVLVERLTPGTGREFEVIDGGLTTWTQRLPGNGKERLLISGMGIEVLCTHFGPP
jgi:hypothetical protein